MTTSDEKLDVLIDQVGRLTEGLTKIKLLVYQQADSVKELVGMVRE
jgi:hypothetical protein